MNTDVNTVTFVPVSVKKAATHFFTSENGLKPASELPKGHTPENTMLLARKY